LVGVVLPGHKSVLKLKSLGEQEPPSLLSLSLASDALCAVGQYHAANFSEMSKPAASSQKTWYLVQQGKATVTGT